MKNDNPDISGDETASNLMHSLTKRSPINPLAPVLVPLDYKASAIAGLKVGINPLLWPKFPALLKKATVSGLLAWG